MELLLSAQILNIHLLVAEEELSELVYLRVKMWSLGCLLAAAKTSFPRSYEEEVESRQITQRRDVNECFFSFLSSSASPFSTGY
jgi:hypothetical protein